MRLLHAWEEGLFVVEVVRKSKVLRLIEPAMFQRFGGKVSDILSSAFPFKLHDLLPISFFKESSRGDTLSLMRGFQNFTRCSFLFLNRVVLAEN